MPEFVTFALEANPLIGRICILVFVFLVLLVLALLVLFTKQDYLYIYIHIYTCYMAVFPCSENVSLFLKYMHVCKHMYMTHFLHNLADTRQMAEKAMAESREHALPVPWFREAAMTRMLIHDSGCNGKPRFYKLDLWHGFHLGIGKSWAAGGLLMIQQFLEGGNMDDRFKQMSAMYVQFCKANKIDKIISKIDKYLCGGGGSAEPLGTWNKAAVTTNLCLFMEWFFTENPDVVTHDDGVYYMVTCFHM